MVYLLRRSTRRILLLLFPSGCAKGRPARVRPLFFSTPSPDLSAKKFVYGVETVAALRERHASVELVNDALLAMIGFDHREARTLRCAVAATRGSPTNRLGATRS